MKKTLVFGLMAMIFGIGSGIIGHIIYLRKKVKKETGKDIEFAFEGEPDSKEVESRPKEEMVIRVEFDVKRGKIKLFYEGKFLDEADFGTKSEKIMEKVDKLITDNLDIKIEDDSKV